MVSLKKIIGIKMHTRRAFTYKALNKLIQGSAADMTKKAMVRFIQRRYYSSYTNT